MSFSAKSITATILVLGSIFLGYFLVFPKWQGYSNAKAQLDANLAQQDQLHQAQQQMNSFLDEYHKHTDAAIKLNQALPLSQTQLYNVLNGLDVLSKQSGITESAISIDNNAVGDQLGAASDSIQTIDLSFTGAGNYSAFRNFLKSLESNLRIMDIESITLTPGDANSLQFNLKVRTYYEK